MFCQRYSVRLSVGLVIMVLIRYVHVQDQPHIPCPQLFHYERHGDQWVGIITPGTTDSNIAIEVHFSSKASTTNAVGSLEKNFENGQQVNYKIPINEAAGSLPKITKLVVNERVVCEASGFGAGSQSIVRVQKSYSTSSTHVGGTLGNLDLSSLLGQSGFFSNILGNRGPSYTSLVECGQEGLVPFQHGGTELERGRFPWLVAIYINSEQKCSGTLVSQRTVVTAAHCIFEQPVERVKAYLGRHDLHVDSESGAIMMDVESTIPHPQYRHIIPEVDVAIIRLVSPVTYTQYIRPICIWRTSDYLGSDSGQEGSVAGWGIDENGNLPPRPKVVNVQTVSRATCVIEMTAARDFLTDRTICAGNPLAHGPCLGDSGGGLTIKRDKRWLLRGIISVGPRAGHQCDLKQYVIYCDLAKHIDWVQNNIV